MERIRGDTLAGTMIRQDNARHKYLNLLTVV